MKTQTPFLKFLLPAFYLLSMVLLSCHKDKTPAPVPGIKNFAPTHGEIDSVITITGYGFSHASTVTLNGTAATVVTATDTEIKFKVPANATAGKIIVKEGDKQYSSSDDFVVTNIWIERSSFQGTYANAISFIYNNKLYMGLGKNATSLNRDFKIFDPQTNSWSQGPELPATLSGKNLATCFVLNNKIYIGNGSTNWNQSSGLTNDWFEFNPAQTGEGAWKNLTGYPVVGIGFAFVLNNKAYAAVPLDFDKRINVFDAEANGDMGQWNPVTTKVPDLEKGNVFTIGNYAYIFGQYTSSGNTTNKIYRFDPTTGNFTIPAPFPGDLLGQNPTFSINGKGYVINQGIYEYNPISNIWTRKNDAPGGSEVGAYNATVINNRAFRWTYLGKMYEYIPSY